MRHRAEVQHALEFGARCFRPSRQTVQQGARDRGVQRIAELGEVLLILLCKSGAFGRGQEIPVLAQRRIDRGVERFARILAGGTQHLSRSCAVAEVQIPLGEFHAIAGALRRKRIEDALAQRRGFGELAAIAEQRGDVPEPQPEARREKLLEQRGLEPSTRRFADAAQARRGGTHVLPACASCPAARR
jgi:hypothetical protein